MEKLLKSVFKYPEMIAAAIELGVTRPVLTIAAIMREGGIIDRYSDNWMSHALAQGCGSDLILQNALYEDVGLGIDPRSIGVFEPKLKRVAQSRAYYAERLKSVTDIEADEGNIIDLRLAIFLGMKDHIFVMPSNDSRYQDSHGYLRFLDKASVLFGRRDDCRIIVGEEFDVPLQNGELPIVRFATRIDPHWVYEYAPEAIVTKAKGIRYCYDRDIVLARCEDLVNGIVISSEDKSPDTEEVSAVFSKWLIDELISQHLSLQHGPACELIGHNRKQVAIARKNRRFAKDLPGYLFDDDALKAHYHSIIGQATRLSDLDLASLKLLNVGAEIARLKAAEESAIAKEASVFEKLMQRDGVTPLRR